MSSFSRHRHQMIMLHKYRLQQIQLQKYQQESHLNTDHKIHLNSDHMIQPKIRKVSKNNIMLEILEKKNIPEIPKFKKMGENKLNLETYKNIMKKQKLVIYVYVLCYNEEFILPHFLKHYDFATKIFIYDNCSTDNSVEIALKDSRCEIIYFSSKFDDIINQTIKNNCWKEHRDQCDYCIVGDMDEFIWHPNNIYDILQKYKSSDNVFSLFPVKGYNMVSENINLDIDKYLYKQIQKGCYSKDYSKINMFCPYSIINMNYSPGSHICKPTSFNSKIIFGPVIILLHYKFIANINMLKKRYNDYSKRMSKINIDNNFGIQYSNYNIYENQYYNTLQNSKKLEIFDKT